MAQRLLIAALDDIVRSGLRAIFAEDKRIADIYEVATKEGLSTFLASTPVDVVIIDQILVTDFTILPQGNFVVVTAEPDIQSLLLAHQYGARGYLSLHVPAVFLRTMLDPAPGAYLIDPTLTLWMMHGISKRTRSSALEDDTLTNREREVERLEREGLNRRAIAQRLSIAPSTVKTHQQHIAAKRSKARVGMVQELSSIQFPGGDERQSKSKAEDRTTLSLENSALHALL